MFCIYCQDRILQYNANFMPEIKEKKCEKNNKLANESGKTENEY